MNDVHRSDRPPHAPPHTPHAPPLFPLCSPIFPPVPPFSPKVLVAIPTNLHFQTFHVWDHSVGPGTAVEQGAAGKVRVASYYTLLHPFIHLYCRICTYVHPLYTYIHHVYT